MLPQAVIPTGSLLLDQALGTGGIPRGCFVEIAGPESSGKTSLCLSILAQAQQQGSEAAFIDTDHTLDPRYARNCGVDSDRLILSEPAHAEQALDTLERLAASGALAVIVLDSLTHLVPQIEFSTQLDAVPSPSISEDAQDQIDALLALSLQRLSQTIQRTQSTVIFTRQTGYRRGAIYHHLSHHPARLALNLHAALRLELLSKGPIHQEKHIAGHKIEIRILRNRFSPCRQSIDLDIMYGQGFRQTGRALE